MSETLTVSAAAKRLGVSRNTVYRMIEDGELATIRLRHGKTRRVITASLDRLLTPRREEFTPTAGGLEI